MLCYECKIIVLVWKTIKEQENVISAPAFLAWTGLYNVVTLKSSLFAAWESPHNFLMVSPLSNFGKHKKSFQFNGCIYSSKMIKTHLSCLVIIKWACNLQVATILVAMVTRILELETNLQQTELTSPATKSRVWVDYHPYRKNSLNVMNSLAEISSAILTHWNWD